MTLSSTLARRAMKHPWVVAAAAGLLSAGVAQAQAPQSADAWRFQITPYVWMTGLQGDIRPTHNAPTAHVSQSFSDVLSNLDTAAFLSGTARQGRYVLQADTSYAAVSDAASLPMGLQARAKVKQSALTLSGGYNWVLSPQDSLDALVGVRWWNIRATVQVQPLLQVRARESFADPIVALRWHHQLNPRWFTLAYADVGGFGVGSDFTWQLLAVLNYQIRDDIYLSAGYRQLNVDYRNGGQRLDFSMGGPILGATFRF